MRTLHEINEETLQRTCTRCHAGPGARCTTALITDRGIEMKNSFHYNRYKNLSEYLEAMRRET